MNGTPFRGMRVHLMGIGGAGVSALVPLLQEVGARVCGSDLAESDVVLRLRAAGIPVALGHDPAHCDSCDVLVHTSAVPPDHEQIRAARARGLPVYSRAAALATLMKGTRTLAVAGSHGKSSTTWMLGHLLTQAGHDPVVMVGGSVASLGEGGGRVGRKGLFIAEVDESDGGFAAVEPHIAVLTNLEAEHIRHYGSFAGLCDAFRGWLGSIPAQGAAVLPATGLDPRVDAGLTGRIIRVGVDRGDVHATRLVLEAEASRFRIHAFGREVAEVHLPTPGLHMVANALDAAAAALLIDPFCDLSTLSQVERVRRRFTVHGTPDGVRVVEDYGHHPTEVKAAIAAAAIAGGAVHVVFQPHRYTRSADCFREFAGAFDAAAAVCLLPVYAAGEAPIAGVGGKDLAEAVAAHRDAMLPGHRHDLVQFAPTPEAALAFVTAHARAGDTVLLLGAGDVGALAPVLAVNGFPAARPVQQ